jgi:hypothetical protein
MIASECMKAKMVGASPLLIADDYGISLDPCAQSQPPDQWKRHTSSNCPESEGRRHPASWPPEFLCFAPICHIETLHRAI